MKKPSKKRWLDGKEFSYVVSWACIVLASAMLFPVVIKSTNAPLTAKITVCVILGIMFLLGVYSLVIDFIDYLQSKKEPEVDEEEELK